MDTNASSLKPASSNFNPAAYRAGGFQYRGFATVLTLSVVAWFGATVVGIAHADAPPQTTATAEVTYADLDLSTERGARALLQRIDIAAKAACGEETHSPLLPRENANVRACVNDAVETAVAKLNSPMIAALRNTYTQSGIALAAR